MAFFIEIRRRRSEKQRSLGAKADRDVVAECLGNGRGKEVQGDLHF